jgi:hypothetical protein
MVLPLIFEDSAMVLSVRGIVCSTWELQHAEQHSTNSPSTVVDAFSFTQVS